MSILYALRTDFVSSASQEMERAARAIHSRPLTTMTAVTATLPAHSDGALRAAPLLCGRGLVKRFGSTAVLHGVDIDLHRGECLAILGPSGCGKSTLLNLIAGFLAADAGRLECDGAALDDPAARIHVPIHRRRFAMVFQDFSLWPHLTVRENVAFGLRLQRVPAPEREDRVLQALHRVRMESFAERRPPQLSGGQQQRVAIARAIVVNPVLLLLDEPLSALDAQLREELRDELAGLIADLQMSTIFVTHDQSEALSLANRVMIMNSGNVEQVASPQEIYDRPRTAFVAGFIGTANVFTGTIDRGDLRLACGARLPLPASVDAHGHAASVLTAMLRREAVAIKPAGDVSFDVPCAPASVRLPVTVTSCCFVGSRYDIVAHTATDADGSTSLRGCARMPLRPGQPAVAELDLRTLRLLEQ